MKRRGLSRRERWSDVPESAATSVQPERRRHEARSFARPGFPHPKRERCSIEVLVAHDRVVGPAGCPTGAAIDPVGEDTEGVASQLPSLLKVTLDRLDALNDRPGRVLRAYLGTAVFNHREVAWTRAVGRMTEDSLIVGELVGPANAVWNGPVQLRVGQLQTGSLPVFRKYSADHVRLAQVLNLGKRGVDPVGVRSRLGVFPDKPSLS